MADDFKGDTNQFGLFCAVVAGYGWLDQKRKLLPALETRKEDNLNYSYWGCSMTLAPIRGIIFCYFFLHSGHGFDR